MKSPANRMMTSTPRLVRPSAPVLSDLDACVCANEKCRAPRAPGRPCRKCGAAAVVYRPCPGEKY